MGSNCHHKAVQLFLFLFRWVLGSCCIHLWCFDYTHFVCLKLLFANVSGITMFSMKFAMKFAIIEVPRTFYYHFSFLFCFHLVLNSQSNCSLRICSMHSSVSIQKVLLKPICQINRTESKKAFFGAKNLYLPKTLHDFDKNMLSVSFNAKMANMLVKSFELHTADQESIVKCAFFTFYFNQ